MRIKSDFDFVISQIPLINDAIEGRLDAWIDLLNLLNDGFKKTYPKKQLKMVREYENLLDGNGEVTEIIIKKGGVDYTFTRNNDDFNMYALFEAIDERLKESIEYRKRRGIKLYQESLNAIDEFGHHTDMAKLFFNHDEIKKILPIERQRLLLMWELYRRAGYPFDRQQLDASDQNKASFIRNWFKRNKNQKITD